MATKSEFFAAIAGQMKNLGFKRRKSNYEYILLLEPGVEGWCSFADSNHGKKSALWVATFVGIRWESIEKRVAAWCGEVIPGWDGRSYVPTVSLNVGYLAPRAKWLEHRIELEAVPIETAIGPNIADVAGFGLDFFKSHGSYAGLAEILKAGTGQMPDARIERLPLALALAGDLQGAYKELEAMKRLVAEESYMSFRYLRFIDGFESEFPSR